MAANWIISRACTAFLGAGLAVGQRDHGHRWHDAGREQLADQRFEIDRPLDQDGGGTDGSQRFAQMQGAGGRVMTDREEEKGCVWYQTSGWRLRPDRVRSCGEPQLSFFIAFTAPRKSDHTLLRRARSLTI